VVDSATGRPLRWQEGPNLVISAPPAAGAAVDAVDSWCRRLQLRRVSPRGGGCVGRLQPPAEFGAWEICGGSGGSSGGGGLLAGAVSNVVPFDRSALASSMGAAHPAVRAAPAQPPPARPPQQPQHAPKFDSHASEDAAAAATAHSSSSLHPTPQQQQQHSASSPAAHPHHPPPSALDDAQAALPSLQHDLERALAALAAHGAPSRRGHHDAAAAAADAVSAAVQGLRQLQSIVLESQGGAPAGAHWDLARLRGAFSPSASPYEECDDEDEAVEFVDQEQEEEEEEDRSGDGHAMNYLPEPAGVGGGAVERRAPLGPEWGGEATWGGAFDDGGGADCGCCSGDEEGLSGPVDPLVAALLSDQCELCCSYVHDAICNSGAGASGEWEGGAGGQPRQ
jgi:hypothetical protein